MRQHETHKKKLKCPGKCLGLWRTAWVGRGHGARNDNVGVNILMGQIFGYSHTTTQ